MNFHQLALAIPKLAQPSCSSCGGTGYVKLPEAIIFCESCLGQDRITGILCWISEKIDQKAKQKLKKWRRV